MKLPLKISDNPGNRQGLAAQMAGYLGSLTERKYSPSTVGSAAYHLRLFSQWCAERGLHRPQEITRPVLELYQSHVLRSLRKIDQKPLSHGERLLRLSYVRLFFRWLTKRGELPADPAADLELPKRRRHLPKNILSVREVEQVLNGIDISQSRGLRDRAMTEVLYSTGIRAAELCHLKIRDIDMERGWLRVEQGKFCKDRMVPIGERALLWLEKYLKEDRPRPAVDPSEERVFLTNRGRPLRRDYLSAIMRKQIRGSGIGKSGSCHVFRHTMATLMLAGGADIRYIQEILGHASLDATQIYTKVEIGKLKEVHAKTHPGAKLSPKPSKE